MQTGLVAALQRESNTCCSAARAETDSVANQPCFDAMGSRAQMQWLGERLAKDYKRAQMRYAPRCFSTSTFENSSDFKVSDTETGSMGTNVLLKCPTRLIQLSLISRAKSTPPGFSTRRISANALFCCSCDFKRCKTRIATAEEN